MFRKTGDSAPHITKILGFLKVAHVTHNFPFSETFVEVLLICSSKFKTYYSNPGSCFYGLLDCELWLCVKADGTNDELTTLGATKNHQSCKTTSRSALNF